MTDPKSTKFVLDLLQAKGLLSKEHAAEIVEKEESHRTKLIKARTVLAKRSGYVQSEVTIVDIIDSLHLPLLNRKNRFLTEEVIMEEIARAKGMPFMRIDPLKLDSDVVTRVVSKPYAVKYQLVPIDLTANLLSVATSNPFQMEGIEGIRHSTKYDIRIVLATPSDIKKIITEFYGFKYSVAAAHHELTSQVDLGNLEQYVKLKSMAELSATDQHVINAVEYLLHYAYAQRASDIHIEPKRENGLIRLRIDGILHNVHKIPRPVHLAFVSRIKTLARLDIAEKRRPQDGRIKTEKDGKEIELRVSTLPVAFGEKAVIRIFDPAILMQEIEELGFYGREMQLFRTFIGAPYGLILVTGPTGSGKTTTLYSALKLLSSPEINITTIEDPVEMVYEEFNQVSVQPKIDVTFASSLRAILRQDPDIIMVGEIRDYETAEHAIQAALTGHLVLSTLHTNDSASSVTRLVDLGVPPFLVNSTLIGVIAQRLVRKICPHCAEKYVLSDEECRMLNIPPAKVKNMPVSIGRGCPECRGTGYFGRTGIFEVLEMSEKVKGLIEQKPAPDLLKKAARSEGMISLKECAIRKLLGGVTSFDEVVRVTGLLP
ncbi:MAG: type II/IV secretion system protein [Nitrospiraceae bacterium]|jgi:general secretion pathway protein E|nr:type II/IV secretion system protein [Nitrospiraceae bacterium]